MTKALDQIEKKNNKRKLYDKTAMKAVLFYFRSRLIKYYFMEKKESPFIFYGQFLKLAYKTGIPAIKMFWRNDGKYLKKSGRKFKHYSKEPKRD